MFALFNKEFFNIDREGSEGQPNYQFDNGMFHNAYILRFAAEVSRVVNRFAEDDFVKHVIIWNEPNDTKQFDKHLDAEHFAALLYHCRHNVRADVKVYWGGVDFGPGTLNAQGQPETDQNSLNYMRAVYDAISSRGFSGINGEIWPWDGVNIHIHHLHREDGPDRSLESVRKIFEDVNSLKVGEKNDNGALIVGEWGVTVEEFIRDDTSLSNLFSWLKPYATQSFFFSHSEHVEGGEWALVRYNIYPGRFFAYQTTVLYTPFDTMIGS